MNLELQAKSTGARLQALERENEKLRDKAGKIGEARSEAQLVRDVAVSEWRLRSLAHAACCRHKRRLQKKPRGQPWLLKISR
jgi:hypothetical protein